MYNFQIVPSYEYGYAVQDGASYSDFEAQEARNGYDTKGSYRINLPDGRVQVQTFSGIFKKTVWLVLAEKCII